MTKKEAIKILNEKMEQGYIAHIALLEIYDDRDDIPEYVVNMLCYKPEHTIPVIICGKDFAEKLKMAFTHMSLCDEFLETPHKQ